MDSTINYYNKIPGILVPRTVTHDSIHSCINEYIDVIPDMAENLESNFHRIGNQYASFVKNMGSLLILLRRVHARCLEIEAEKILHSVQHEAKMSLASRDFKPFISSLLSMSIEMQKAQRAEDEEVKGISEAEAHADMANNLSAVGNLIDSGEDDKALNLIAELDEHNPEAVYAKLLDLITGKKYADAESMLISLKEKHIEAINAGSDMSKTIMAVDDKPEILSFIKNVLKNHYKIIVVPGGNIAVKAMQAQKPDLFILDIDMPKMDGYELAGIIRATDEYRNTPIIFLTGNSSRQHIAKAIEVGANDFIIKPASNEILLTKISKFLK